MRQFFPKASNRFTSASDPIPSKSRLPARECPKDPWIMAETLLKPVRTWKLVQECRKGVLEAADVFQ